MPARFGARRFAYGEVPFDPMSLFMGGAYSGFLYDFAPPPTSTFGSGISPAYQNQSNTIASADGNPVGLLIDRSQGVVVGPEVVVNGTPGATTTGWTPAGTSTIAVVGDEIELTTDGTANRVFGSAVGISSIVGEIYEVTGYFRCGTVPTARFQVYGNTVLGQLTTTNTTPTFVHLFVRADTSSFKIYLGANGANTAGQTAYFKLISAKRISGNHGLQATAAAKPTLKLTNGIWRTDYDGGDSLATAFAPGASGTAVVAFRSTAAGVTIVGAKDTSNGWCSINLDASGYLTISLGSSTAAYQGAVDLRNADHVVACSWTGGVGRVWIDYVNVGTFSYSGTPTTTNGLALCGLNTNGTVGSQMAGRWYKGQAANTAANDNWLQQASRYFGRGIV